MYRGGGIQSKKLVNTKNIYFFNDFNLKYNVRKNTFNAIN